MKLSYGAVKLGRGLAPGSGDRTILGMPRSQGLVSLHLERNWRS